MRDILHCDLNGFFASVECLKHPELKNVPMAVCGDPETRHGVILAKNDLAKKYGVVTAETIYSAKKKCPKLALVKATHSDYVKYSNLVNQVYLKYTERVEPFSIDESFLDVTESKELFGTPYEIAYKIKEDVKHTLGLTISVGVSFNRILAKMGSDMKKPDAITVLSKENFKNILFPMPISELLFCGISTCNTFNKMRIYTIGDLANSDITRISKKIGKLGCMLHNYANGIDSDFVELYGTKHTPKSISKGVTFPEDITDIELLSHIIRKLTDYISSHLRKKNLTCTIVCVTIKDNLFCVVNRQKQIFKTNLFQDISSVAIHILKENYTDNRPIRAMTVSVSGLKSQEDEIQLDLFSINQENQRDTPKEKIETATKTLDNIRNKFGNKITFGSMIDKNR
ncbi:MAG: DNA polymerase IV [Clostridia bacterium]|nr:DNA polymerase IV [Clostridia bacterium]